MRLKRLELVGFKSFPKKTVLEFPHSITAIVGPNGSGKSNLKEAIQWVLGEQSMKSLRGRRGEDLVWNGSDHIPRVGKASVSLVFDNRDRKIPIEFEEVIISRKIFRDGTSEYTLNDSQVRLKDILLLMARVGLGEMRHNIIGQGEVDKILLVSPAERRKMLEEALGLKVYQLKKNETERKLTASLENTRQAEALVKEIYPHLKFLRSQVKKAEIREKIAAELVVFQKVYFFRKKEEFAGERERLKNVRLPLEKQLSDLRVKIESAVEEIRKKESVLAGSNLQGEDEKKFLELDGRRREILREIGRLEGRLEVLRQGGEMATAKPVDLRQVKDEIGNFLAEIKDLLEEEDRVDVLKANLLVLVEDLEEFLEEINQEASRTVSSDNLFEIRELEGKILSLQQALNELGVEIAEYEASRRAIRDERKELGLKIRELDRNLRAWQDEERELSLRLERFKFDEERLDLAESELEREMKEAGFSGREIFSSLPSDILHKYKMLSSEELKDRILRLSAKLEEIGALDPAMLKEYEETEARHAFLTKEVEDLKKASRALKELVRKLDEHIHRDFKNGFAKIKEEFSEYFRIIFGGGRASLKLVEPARTVFKLDEGEVEKERENEPGVEISVELPQKRIKSLAMLSGGERALTSVALLFALTAVNPPPFLVLDETDAALDEANSRRYAAILKELSKKTQLLLITHNRETMKCAGVLYGVTMGEDGASRLLSLKFEEAEVYTNR